MSGQWKRKKDNAAKYVVDAAAETEVVEEEAIGIEARREEEIDETKYVVAHRTNSMGYCRHIRKCLCWSLQPFELQTAQQFYRLPLVEFILSDKERMDSP